MSSDTALPEAAATPAPAPPREPPAGRTPAAGAPAAPAGRAPVAARKKRKRAPVAKPWFVRLHRWTSMALGLFLLLECVSGAVLLMAPDLMRVGHGDRYQHTAGPNQLTALQALALVERQRPDLEPHQVRRFRGVWTVSGDGADGPALTAFVDPGARVINDVGVMEPGYLRFLDNLHENALGSDDDPGFVPFMDVTLWGDLQVRSLVLGTLGLLLAFLCVSGIVIWWPTIRKFATGFRIRRGRGSYARDLDLHKVIGIVSVPMLAMWGVSGANFEFDWPQKAYYWALPGSEPVQTQDPEPGTAKRLSRAQAQAIAVALHPDARIVGVDVDDPLERGGSYRFRMVEGFDVDKDSTSPGNVDVTVDSHGGGVRDRGKVEGPITTKYWESWQDGLHFGSFVPWIPRLLVGVVFGLAPVVLGITGVAIWLVKRRSRRSRAARKKLDAPA